MMIIETIDAMAVPGLYTNCYLAADEDTREGVVIDPGGSAPAILKKIADLKLTITLVLNTHGHFDHIMADREIMEATGAALAAHRNSLDLFRASGGAALFGLRVTTPVMPSRLLEEDDEIHFGSESLRVLYTPGHTPGCISFWSEAQRVVFDGDVLFNAGIGRTDLPGGNYRTLMNSIRHKILELPDDTVVYPGHGPHTTVGQEKRSNPFLGSESAWV
jgi:hydroxyacylglutathione hydrolase